MFIEQAGRGFVQTKKDEYEFDAATLAHDQVFLYIHHVVSGWIQAVPLEHVVYVHFNPVE